MDDLGEVRELAQDFYRHCRAKRLAVIRQSSGSFLDTGVRVAELAGIKIEDVNFDTHTVQVLGKGDKERVVRLGNKTVEVMCRYQRVRVRHKYADLDEFWIGSRSALTTWRIAMILRNRGTYRALPSGTLTDSGRRSHTSV